VSTIQPSPDPMPASIPDAGPPTALPAAKPTRRGRWLGPIPITPVSVVVALALFGSLIFIVYVTLKVHDDQIKLLSVGFVVFGAAWAAIAVGALVAMWRAASWARTGRATALAIAGGIAGLSAIGSFAIAAILALVLNS
jgi:hypothetical protein